ncbi:MAG: helix-turn-helix domain-containing protein [Bradyrhizobium sp.]
MARKKTARHSPLTRTILSTAKDMYAGGVISKRTHEKITLRHFGDEVQSVTRPLTGKQIRALRDKENISQAVLAHHLHVSVGYVSQLERDERRPMGPTLVLLNVIQRKGLEAIL